jgi:hypothetical protein
VPVDPSSVVAESQKRFLLSFKRSKRRAKANEHSAPSVAVEFYVQQVEVGERWAEQGAIIEMVT